MPKITQKSTIQGEFRIEGAMAELLFAVCVCGKFSASNRYSILTSIGKSSFTS